MATTLLHKRSSTAGQVPSTSSLEFGEIAANTNDGYLFIKRDNGSGQEILTFKPSVGAQQETIYLDTFTGDGSTVAFTLTVAPRDDQYAFVTINGVQQHASVYSLSQDELTFSSAPALNDAIEVRTLRVIATDVTLRDRQKYYYTITSTTSSLSGTDDVGNTLTYDAGMIDIFQNGVKLVDGSDFTATNGTSVAFTTSLESGDIVEVISYGKAAILDHDAISPGTTLLSTTATDQVVDTFETGVYRTAKYLISATNSTNYHTTEINLIHDGTTVYMTEYGTIYTNTSLVSFNADITSGHVRLLCTPSSGNTTVKLQRITVAT
jgi:hypothetical protein